MTIILHSTAEICEVQGPKGTYEARVWEGQTESGVKISALIPRLAVHKDDDTAQFEKELKEQTAPKSIMQAFPLRMIL